MVDGISGINSGGVNQIAQRQSSPLVAEESKEPANIPEKESNEVSGAPVTARAASAEESNEANDNPAEEKNENGNLGKSVNIQA